MRDFHCRFCGKSVVLAQTDGSRLCFSNVEGVTACIEIKRPYLYFPIRCGRCGEETRWWGKEEG